MSKNTTSRTMGSHGGTVNVSQLIIATRVWDPNGESTHNVPQLTIITTPKVTTMTMSHVDRRCSNLGGIPNPILWAPVHPRDLTCGPASKAWGNRGGKDWGKDRAYQGSATKSCWI